MVALESGKRIALDPASILGQGGEATIYSVDAGTVAKLWHQPSSARTTKLERILARNGAWPRGVIAPVAKLLDETTGTVVGALMPRVASSFAPFATLLKRGARESFGLSQSDVVELLITLADAVDALHAMGVVVGDLNDQNELWNGQDVAMIDVDSFQLDREPCPVATEAYLDPALYDVDLESAPSFTDANDHYALATLAFRALTSAHPFGGTHKSLRSIAARARAGVWVLSTEVTYPKKVALPAGVLTPEVRDWFERIFVEGAREPLPRALLRQLVARSAPCGSCGLVAPRDLDECPACSTTKPAPPRSALTSVTAEIVLHARGLIHHVQVLGESIHVISSEDGRLVHHVIQGAQTSRRDVGAHDARAQVAVLAAGELAVARRSEIVLFSAAGQLLLTTSTEDFESTSVMAAAGDSLLRLAGNVLVAGQRRGDVLLERPVRSVLAGQTWLTSPNHRRYLALGADRIFRTHHYFALTEDARIDLEARALAVDEVHLTSRMHASDDGVLLLRETRTHTTEHVRTELFDARGVCIASSRIAKNAAPGAGIEGRAFRGSVLLHPTDDGIARERLMTSAPLAIVPGTEPYVSAASLLFAHPRGLLVADGAVLTLLRIS